MRRQASWEYRVAIISDMRCQKAGEISSRQSGNDILIVFLFSLLERPTA